MQGGSGASAGPSAGWPERGAAELNRPPHRLCCTRDTIEVWATERDRLRARLDGRGRQAVSMGNPGRNEGPQ